VPLSDRVLNRQFKEQEAKERGAAVHGIPGTTNTKHGPTLGATSYHKIYVAIKASGVGPSKLAKIPKMRLRM